ncbi:hypothetical protein A3Q56_04081 [Intoshia linei]|uniref:poly(A)-specific ribonuclease n=1 Tax=Intoshia linei TaxID=1819745 RepID=A0A177B1K6_9BILA|nr:hypothetical protein A3Q56_04081 [Intoshia linei]
MSEDEKIKNGIINVWSNNFTEQYIKMTNLIEKYPYVAMDTEFPGVVARPLGEFRYQSDHIFQLLRCNVDLLKLIQLGITLMNEKGQVPDGISTWQFNFKFNLDVDMHAHDSIQMLQEAGIDFSRHASDGIDHQLFGEMFMVSGLVLNKKITWISFHSTYDYGYLMKLLLNKEIPESCQIFLNDMDILFPKHYDIKYLIKSCGSLKGGLQELANCLNVERVGMKHQAGSDSLVTGHVFFSLVQLHFDNNIEGKNYENYMYGLGNSKGMNLEKALETDDLGLPYSIA